MTEHAGREKRDIDALRANMLQHIPCSYPVILRPTVEILDHA